MSEQRRVWARMLGPIWRRIRLLISRGVIALIDDSAKLQRVQVTRFGGQPAWAERFQNYGLTAYPHKGAEAIVAAVGGASSHLVALAVDDRRHRPKGLQEGEVCLYTDEGDEIRLKRGRVIAIKAGAALDVEAPQVTVKASTSVTLDTPSCEMTGNLAVTGDMTVGGPATFANTAAIAGLATLGGLAVTGGGGAASIQGGLDITSGDVTADGISLKTHTHTDSQGGQTGPAQ